ncbi:MAG TPA: hypothetical protein VFP47_18550 [Pyrinomonadaceae bacterium]|nr:hypothetical protein [Pyrinomonadaceae bacterium]
MEENYYYTTEVQWTGERHGDLSAPVLPSLRVDAPPELKVAGVWTPEHLLVGAVNSCFMTTFLVSLRIPNRNLSISALMPKENSRSSLGRVL